MAEEKKDDVSVDVKKAIVEQNLQVIRNSIYAQVISKRVAEKVEDKPMADAAIKELTRLEKMKDEFNAVLAELK
jgi:hypothetical protein